MSGPEDRLPEDILWRRARRREIRQFLITFFVVLAIILLTWRTCG